MAKVLGKPSADDVKRVAVAALVAALDDSKEKARKKPALTGMRAMATGAVLYTAGRAVVGGRRFINERLNGAGEEESADEYDDEPVAEDDEDFDEEDEPEEDEDPVAEEDEDFEDEEDEEPEAEEDEDFEEDEEPEAEEDEDFEDEDEDFEDEEEEPEAE